MELIQTFGLTLAAVKMVVVGVVDSGIKPEYNSLVSCNTMMNRDFTDTGLDDRLNHGTIVSGLIYNNVANKRMVCQVIIKYVDQLENYQEDAYVNALTYASSLKLDYLNLSIQGENSIQAEYVLIEKMLNKGVKIIAAAGNKHKNMDLEPVYPAMLDDRIVVVGNTSNSSNYGSPVDTVIDGNNKEAFGILASGTSMSAAIHTGKLVNAVHKGKRK